MSHEHGQDSPDSPENPWAGQGAVMLDIGGDVGALVVEMPLESVGREVEVLAHGRVADVHHHDHAHDHAHGHDHDHGHEHPPHVAVVRRPVAAGEPVPSLVFDSLTAGRYDLVEKGTRDVVLTAAVRGGEVSWLTWPSGG
ncbi:hypothetical protein [Nocardioides nanhaiensis]|uniref:Uncharacterized protein n=1 Tax=Nocardioides nanhaiensis TaxID=1476871 RepID=A0ABP8WG53_9ACTN